MISDVTWKYFTRLIRLGTCLYYLPFKFNEAKNRFQAVTGYPLIFWKIFMILHTIGHVIVAGQMCYLTFFDQHLQTVEALGCLFFFSVIGMASVCQYQIILKRKSIKEYLNMMLAFNSKLG